MKEMVGGCCVCSDERGWAENPLVYCDGHGCNVAVHQACYGIVQVPTGPWYCRKCESQERQARVRCELCPQKDGALKRTDTQGWCHVVCALFIPEAWFANVQTMEPIVLKNVPPERFNKICYVCEEQGRETRSTQGSCMTCNKNGCKQNFHVTCAQAQGLLCEEAGNYGDNVKYCGYCAYHYKKLQKKDANIKTIPAFKPIPSENATPDTTPEKIAPVKPDKEKARKIFTIFCDQSKDKSKLSSENSTTVSTERGTSDGNKSLTHTTPPSLNNSAMSDSSSMMSPEFAGFTEADLKNHPGNAQSETNDKPETPVSTSSNSSASPPAHDQKLIMDARFTVSEANLFSANSSPFTNASPASSSGTGEVTSPTQNHDSFSGTFEKFASSGPVKPLEDSAVTVSDGDQHSVKRSRSRSQEKEKKKVRHGKVVSSGSLKGKVGKDGLHGKVVLTPGAKKLSMRRKSAGTANGSAASTAGLNSFCNSVFGGSPCFQSLSAPGPVQLSGFSQSGGNTSGGESSKGGGDADNNPVNGYTGPPKIFPSLIKSGEAGGFPVSMEQLLEKQWEQGSQFLMEQSQHFDIASLLNCLHQLKTENTQLEEYVKSLTERRNQLLSINARLSLPFNAISNSSIPHSPPDSPPDIKPSHVAAASSSDHSSSQSPAPPIINPITPSNSDDPSSPNECLSPLTAGSGTVRMITERSHLGQIPTIISQDQKSSSAFSLAQSPASTAVSCPQPLQIPNNRVTDTKPKDKT